MGRHEVVTLNSKRRTVVGASALVLATLASVAAIETSSGVSATTANLVKDPAFLTGVTNWTTTAGGSLSMATGHDGHRAIRLLNNSAGTMTLALNDRVNTVATTTAGARYLASAWVRTDSPGVTAGARMMEYQGSTLHGSKQGSAWLRTGDWYYVSTNYTAVTDASSIDFNVLGWQLPTGKSLLISEPSLVQTAGATSSSSSASSSSAPAARPAPPRSAARSRAASRRPPRTTRPVRRSPPRTSRRRSARAAPAPRPPAAAAHPARHRRRVATTWSGRTSSTR